jgi:cob(I)alamin adenosyltransferase
VKIYTKTGDNGTTGLFSGGRVSKNSSYIEAYGTVDELNAWIGFCIAASRDKEISEDLLRVQNELHGVCADLATPDSAKAKVERIKGEWAKRLESRIDALELELRPLTQFILAGGSELSARLHVARTVCRRAERLVVDHASKEKVNAEVVTYLNRLSDYLFVLARVANRRTQVEDVLWDPKK